MSDEDRYFDCHFCNERYHEEDRGTYLHLTREIEKFTEESGTRWHLLEEDEWACHDCVAAWNDKVRDAIFDAKDDIERAIRMRARDIAEDVHLHPREIESMIREELM